MTKKWNFTHYFWIERDEEPDASDFDPLTVDYEFQKTRWPYEKVDAKISDVEIERDADACDENNQTSWCVTGIIETDAELPQEDVDNLSWEVVSEHAYQCIRELIWGNEWYSGDVSEVEEDK